MFISIKIFSVIRTCHLCVSIKGEVRATDQTASEGLGRRYHPTGDDKDLALTSSGQDSDLKLHNNYHKIASSDTKFIILIMPLGSSSLN